MNPEILFNQGLAQTTLHPLGAEVERADGAFIYLTDGTQLLDLISGVGVSAFGHNHPKIILAIQEQLTKHLHVMVYGEFRQKTQEQAARKLTAILPDPLDTVFFVNSGAEAVEGALKLARRVTGRTALVAVEGGYHGSTMGALSVSSHQARKAPFEPLIPDVQFMAFNTMEGLEMIDGSQAACIVETVQGDAGIRIPDREWLVGLRARCDQTGTLLILDEIQCGFGRTGRPMAFEHFGVVPDVVCLGKALGGGMPIGAFVAARSHMQALAENPALGHITTFGGHPLVCAAASAALSLLEDVSWETLELRGARLHQILTAHPAVREVRRIGYYIAVELDDAQKVIQMVDLAREKGLLLFYFLSSPNAFRLAPPLNISEAEMEWATTRLTQTLDALLD